VSHFFSVRHIDEPPPPNHSTIRTGGKWASMIRFSGAQLAGQFNVVYLTSVPSGVLPIDTPGRAQLAPRRAQPSPSL